MFYGGFIAAVYHGSYMFITTTSKYSNHFVPCFLHNVYMMDLLQLLY